VFSNLDRDWCSRIFDLRVLASALGFVKLGQGEEMRKLREQRSDQTRHQRGRKLRAHKAHAEQEPKVFLQSDKPSEHHLNDDKSPLIDLLTCIVCKRTMKLEKSAPDAEGRDIIQYRCELCDGIERVRLFRRSRDAPFGR
jgi:hypothetical protein